MRPVLLRQCESGTPQYITMHSLDNKVAIFVLDKLFIRLILASSDKDIDSKASFRTHPTLTLHCMGVQLRMCQGV